MDDGTEQIQPLCSTGRLPLLCAEIKAGLGESILPYLDITESENFLFQVLDSVRLDNSYALRSLKWIAFCITQPEEIESVISPLSLVTIRDLLFNPLRKSASVTHAVCHPLLVSDQYPFQGLCGARPLYHTCVRFVIQVLFLQIKNGNSGKMST